MTIQPHRGGDAPARRGVTAVSGRTGETRTLSAVEDQHAVAGDEGPGTVWVLGGPNLGRLGQREPETYGSTTHQQLADRLIRLGRELGVEVEVRQTDDEATMIGWLHQAADRSIPVILNPAAWTHYSIAVRDAAAMRTADLIEVHLSNIHAREGFRRRSVIGAVATGTIVGLGVAGYEAALRILAGPSAAGAGPRGA